MREQQVVLATGCSTGLGREICEILTGKGYIVVATARNTNTLENVPAALRLKLDVTDRESIDEAVKQIVQQFQRIDILVNNAGYSVRGALEEIPLKDVKQVFDVNVFGIIQMLQAVVPHMRKEERGKIINIGSVSGKFAQPINGGYCASKHAVEAISDALRMELFPFHIQSTVIGPGPIQTQFFQTLAKRSKTVFNNSDSPYRNFYLANARHREKQIRTDSKLAAMKICNIIEKVKLRPRYKVAVPFRFRLLLSLPDSMREGVLMK